MPLVCNVLRWPNDNHCSPKSSVGQISSAGTYTPAAIPSTVQTIAKNTSAAADGHAGQQQYNQFCIACHGADGSGNPLLGAPSLVDDIWLYGDSEEALRQSIAQGRSGEMPAFGSRLDDTQIRLLLALLAGNSPTE